PDDPADPRRQGTPADRAGGAPLRLLADRAARDGAALGAPARPANILRRLHGERAGDAARHPARGTGRRDAAAHEAPDRSRREGGPLMHALLLVKATVLLSAALVAARLLRTAPAAS